MLRGAERRLEAIFKAPARAKARKKYIFMEHVSECRAARAAGDEVFSIATNGWEHDNAHGITTTRFIIVDAR
jgi:hypothetical protein